MVDLSKDVHRSIKEFILNEFLPGEEPETLSDDTPLITGGVLDSIKITILVIFLEDTFKIEFQAHEINADYFDTLNDIANIVQTKIGDRA